MKQVKKFETLYSLIYRKRSVCYGQLLRRVPAAVFVNFNFNHVYNLVKSGRVFIYEKKGNKK